MSSKLCRTRTSDAHTSADVHAGGMPSRPVTHRRGTGGCPGLWGHLGPAECEIPISTSELCMSGLKKASRRAALMPSRSACGWGSGREGGRDDFYQARSGLAATLSKQAAVGSAPRRTQAPNPVRDGRDNGRACSAGVPATPGPGPVRPSLQPDVKGTQARDGGARGGPVGGPGGSGVQLIWGHLLEGPGVERCHRRRVC